MLIHAANAFLLCLVLRRVLPVMLAGAADQRLADWIALGVALAWAVHPVHNAAVAYISGTADTLAMTFLPDGGAPLRAGAAIPAARRRALPVPPGDSFVCCSGCARRKSPRSGSCSISVTCSACGGKPRRANVGAWSRWAVLALAAYLGLRHLPGPPPIPPPMPDLPPKWVLMLRALGDYGSLLVFPNKLFMERQVFAAGYLAGAPDEALYLSLAIAGVAMLAAFALGCLWTGRGQRLRRVGVVWFLVGFLPISNLFALNSSVAEHWLYLPSIGFFLFVVGVGLDTVPRLRSRRPVSPGRSGGGDRHSRFRLTYLVPCV